MNLDTLAILDVAAPAEPEDLVRRLEASPALSALVPRFGPEWEPKGWSVEPSSVHAGGLDVVGPGGIVLRLGRRSVEVYHVLTWKRFVSDPEDRRLVRRAVRAVARLVGSKRAVWTHELAATDREPEEGTEEVTANLSAAVGPPSTSFDELASATPHRAGSWLVDTFEDLDVS